MKLDNSQAAAWNKCPWYWRERYLFNLEPRKTSDALEFGTRMHHLLERRLLGEAADPCDAPFEPEAQVMLAAYAQQYPTEPFDMVRAEQYFEVPLPREVCGKCHYWAALELLPQNDGQYAYYCRGCDSTFTQHIFNGKIDGVVRDHVTGMLNILEHKTEKRGGKRNSADAWAARPQVGLYLWAAEQLYGETVDQIVLDVLTRQSPKGQEPATFSRQHLQRSREQITQALRDITWVADQIEAMTQQFGTDPYMSWPADKEQCVQNNWKCDYHSLHIIGRSEEVLEAKYQQAQPYLSM